MLSWLTNLKCPMMLNLEDMTVTVPGLPHLQGALTKPKMIQTLWVHLDHLLISQGAVAVSVFVRTLLCLLMITIFYSCTKTTSTGS